MHWAVIVIAGIVVTFATSAQAGNGKLLATSGLHQLEGSGGGGLTPWATLAGYDEEGQYSVNLVSTGVYVNDFKLQVLGLSASWSDRFEISFARHNFDLKTFGGEIKQNVVGLKARVYGDVVYSTGPQIAVGLQYKRLLDGYIASLLNADDQQGTDFYMSATKVHLAALYGYNLFWNLTARVTKANQLGLLGFGHSTNNSYELHPEISTGVLVSPKLAVGLEYRSKPNFLNLKEEDWYDFFVAYFPSKQVSLVGAYSNLGIIAGQDDQQGLYLSLSLALD